MLSQIERKSILAAETKPRAVIYARVSTDEQAETGTSLEAQVRAAIAYAEKAGLEVVRTFREDFTGTKLDRPEFNQVRAMLQTGQADALIVYKSDRLDRSWMGYNTLIIMQELMAINAELHYSENAHKVDFDNPMDVFMWGSLGGWQAGVDRDNIVKKLQLGRQNRAREGYVVPSGQHIPYGYNKVKRNGRWYFEIDPEKAEHVKMIFHWYVYDDENGKPLSYRGIIKKLGTLGIKPVQSKTKTYWNVASIGAILQNETYIGTWHYGKKAAHKNIPVSVPAIIDRELFDQAAKARKERLKRSGRGVPLLLSGIAECPVCGASMVKVSVKSGYCYYQCNGACIRQPSQKEKCPHKKLYPEKLIDNAIWAEIAAIITDPKRRRAGIDAYQKRQQGRVSPLQIELQNVGNAIKSINKDLNALYEAFRDATGKRHRVLLNSDIERTESQLEALESRRETLESQIADTAGTPEAAADLDKILEAMVADLETIGGDLTSKRQFLRRIGFSAIMGTDAKDRRYVSFHSKIGDGTFYTLSNIT